MHAFIGRQAISMAGWVVGGRVSLGRTAMLFGRGRRRRTKRIPSLGMAFRRAEKCSDRPSRKRKKKNKKIGRITLFLCL